MPVTEAQKRAIKNYEKNNIDKLTIRLPKGMKTQITEAGANSVNSFIIEAVQEKLQRNEEK